MSCAGAHGRWRTLSPARSRSGDDSDSVADDSRTGEQLAYLAAVVDTSSDAIISKNLDGTITSWNAAATRIFGFTADEMIGQNVRRLIPEELQEEEDEILAELRAGRFVDHFETVRVSKEGRRINVSLSISPIRSSSGEIIGAAKIARDITARKEADELLAAATAKFESVFNQSAIFAGIADPEGVLREVNDLALDGFGYTKEEVLGLPFWATPWWRGSDRVQARIRGASERVAAGGEFRDRVSCWLADGSECVVDVAMHPIRNPSGQVRFLHATWIDVTERIQAEEALRAREAEEREIAVGLQRALLPDRLTMPEGVSCIARYEAGSDALEVGGDWYDAFVLEDGRVALTVGDVVGHGLNAAAAMGKLRTALVALTEYADSPGELLTRLDRFLAQNRTTEFATVCYGVLDPATGVFEYAWAGHPPMVLVTPAGDIRWLDEGGSPPLSAEGERARPHASIVLEAGSFLVLYSDGLVERRGEPLERGLDRLAHACERLVDMPIESICDHLVSALGVESARDDDVAVLAVRLDAVPTAVFRRVFPARAEELHGLRAAMRAWLSERRVGEPEQKALMLAVGEACANAIEHAYRGSDPGDVSVEIGEGGQSSLEVAVRDFGRFRFGPNAEERGRGSAIIRGLTTDFTRESTGEGTTVRFRLPVDRQVVSV